MIKFAAPAKKLYCEKCEDFVDYKIMKKKDIYKVKGTDEIKIDAKIAFCSNCGSELFDIHLENENLKKAFRIYAEKHGLVLPEEIKSIRKKYALSQELFAKILGIGKATIERYENGSLPSESLSNLIRSAKDPKRFLEMLEKAKNNKDFPHHVYERVCKRIETLLETNEKANENSNRKTLENAYRKTSASKDIDFPKFYAVVLVVLDKLKRINIEYVYKTKFFKLLWLVESKYYDNFKQILTGVAFAHMPMGPAPDRYGLLIETLREAKVAKIKEVEYSKYDSSTQIIPHDLDLTFKDVLKDEEISFIEKIIREYGTKSKEELIEITHRDPRWLNTKDGDIISLD